jgi:hypothetical protein
MGKYQVHLEAEEGGGKAQTTTFCKVSVRQAKQCKVNSLALASLNNSIRF